jgi:hypothetical protein
VSGDSRILWPLASSGDGQGRKRPVYGGGIELPPMMMPHLSDVQTPVPIGDSQAVRIVMPTPSPGGAVATPKGEVMKLVMLVVFFLLWISTASTLLFLYMDRYLFPG